MGANRPHSDRSNCHSLLAGSPRPHPAGQSRRTGGRNPKGQATLLRVACLPMNMGPAQPAPPCRSDFQLELEQLVADAAVSPARRTSPCLRDDRPYRASVSTHNIEVEVRGCAVVKTPPKVVETMPKEGI